MEITKKDLLNGLTSKMNPVTEAADNNLSKVGDIKLYKLDQKTIGILTDRIKDEYTAHYFYRAAANWCQDMNYKKAFAFWMDWVVNIHSKIAGKPLIVYKAPSLFPHDKKSNVKHNNLKEIAVMIITVACIAKMITTTSEKYNSV